MTNTNIEIIVDELLSVLPFAIPIGIIIWGFGFVFRLLFYNENITYKNNDYIIYEEENKTHQENNKKTVCEYCDTVYENNLTRCPYCNASNKN